MGGEREKRRDTSLPTRQEVKKMDGERGYEWGEALFF